MKKATHIPADIEKMAQDLVIACNKEGVNLVAFLGTEKQNGFMVVGIMSDVVEAIALACTENDSARTLIDTSANFLAHWDKEIAK